MSRFWPLGASRVFGWASIAFALIGAAPAYAQSADVVTVLVRQLDSRARHHVIARLLLFNHGRVDIDRAEVRCIFNGRAGTEPLIASARLNGVVVAGQNREFSGVDFGQSSIARTSADCRVVWSDAVGAAAQISPQPLRPPAPAAQSSGNGDAGLGLILIALILAVYALPTVIALNRGHQSAGGIIVVNLLLGWTFVGWVAALAWSLSAVTRQG